MKKASVFFYGSYINFDVLKEVNIILENWEVAKLNGYDIVIRPRANLIKSEMHCVFGIITSLSHSDLEKLYTHAKNVLGELYLPEAVLLETKGNKWLPALCYICHDMQPRPAENDYINRIIKLAKKLGLPNIYIEKIGTFFNNGL